MIRRLCLAAFAVILSGCSLSSAQQALLDFVNRPPASGTPCREWAGAFRLAHFRDEDGSLGRILSIAHRESRCDPAAFRPGRKNGDGLPDLGLVQIHFTWAPQLEAAGIISRYEDLTNPGLNARAAEFILAHQGWAAWTPR